MKIRLQLLSEHRRNFSAPSQTEIEIPQSTHPNGCIVPTFQECEQWTWVHNHMDVCSNPKSIHYVISDDWGTNYSEIVILIGTM